MRIVSDPPPIRIRQACREKFGAEFDDGIVFTHGETIHSKYSPRPDVVVHEKVHIRQQLVHGIINWWDRYLSDNAFRLEQELEAYQAQWKWIKKNVKSRNDQAKYLKQIGQDLSGPMYGNIMTFQEALIKIKNGK